MQDRIATIRLNRPDRKNPLTFDSYAELRDTFRALAYATDVDVVVFASNGGNFCSGGDVHDIIGPLIGLPMKELLAFTRMTGDLVKAMIGCGKPVIAAVDGVCVGAGAIIAMAVGPAAGDAGGEMRVPVHPRRAWRAATWGPAPCCPGSSGRGGRRNCSTPGAVMSAEEGERWGFWNALHAPEALEAEAHGAGARGWRRGRPSRMAITKTQLMQEWNMGLEQAIEAEAQAQAICMQTKDFERAYRAFVAKEKPVFAGD